MLVHLHTYAIYDVVFVFRGAVGIKNASIKQPSPRRVMETRGLVFRLRHVKIDFHNDRATHILVYIYASLKACAASGFMVNVATHPEVCLFFPE